MTRNVIGAHSLGFNTGTVGVALIGNYSTRDADAARAGRARAAARLAPRHRARRSALAGRRHLGRQREVQGREGRDAARDLGPPRHRPDASARATARTRCSRRSRERVAATGLPKLYSVAASGALGGADPLPGPALVGAAVDGDRDDRGRQGRRARQRPLGRRRLDVELGEARARGRSAGAIDAGAKVFPAQGTLGGRFPCRPPTRADADHAADADPRADHARDADAQARAGRPGDLGRRPDRDAGDAHARLADGTGLAATVELHARRRGAGDGDRRRASPAGLAAPRRCSRRASRPGRARTSWDIGILANGRYKLVVTATPTGALTPVVATADVTVDRTLGGFLADAGVVLAERRRGERHDRRSRSRSTQSGVGAGRDPARRRRPSRRCLGPARAGHADDRLGRHELRRAPARRRLRRGRHRRRPARHGLAAPAGRRSTRRRRC